MNYITTILYLLLSIIFIEYFIRLFSIIKHLRKAKNLMHQSKPFNKILKNPKIKVLFIGDSTGVGTGAKPAESIAGLLSSENKKISVTNLSYNGAYLSSLIHQLKKVREKFDITIIMAGNNDIFHLNNLQHSTKDLEKAIKLTKAQSKAVILMPAGNIGSSPVIPWPINWYYTYRTRKFHKAYHHLANKYKIIFIEMFTSHFTHLFIRRPRKYYAIDNFHPSAEGYRISYENLKKKMREHNLI